jgi:Eukaryotic aspartyl protease
LPVFTNQLHDGSRSRLTPYRYYNNSYIYDESPQCGSTPTNECISIRGGAFDEAASTSLSSSVKFSDFSALDQQAGVGTDTVLTGSDTFTINGSLTVEQYPFGVPRTDQMQFLDFSQLGMGKDSSLLTMLRNQGSIASRSFSLYWGETGMSSDHQLDGNLVIGGLDEAKISGENYTTQMDHGSPCPSGMLLSVTDMSLVFPSGASRSIMAAAVGQSVNYCLAPEYPIITMPQPIFEQWVAAHPGSATDGNADGRAGGFPNVWGLVYSPDIM